MDIALCLEKLGIDEYRGSIVGNSRTEYDLIILPDGVIKPTWADLETVWPDVEKELERGQVLRDLAASDADMARISEDLIDAGGDTAMLPRAALDKIAARKALRTRLAELE